MDDMQQFKDTYITECRELLAEMEEQLLELDVEQADIEALNSIFRCAHSIKGGAGAFGFDEITKFTHVAEFLLDAMRETQVQASQEIVDALLKSVDVITQMIDCAQAGHPVPEGLGDVLSGELQQYAEGAGGENVAAPTPVVSDAPATESQEQILYQIHFKPHRNLFSSGNEPLLLIRELASLGDIEVTCHQEAVPELDKLEPEDCHLSWDISLDSDKSEDAIREVFEFVEDECDLEIDALGGFTLPQADADTSSDQAQPVHSNGAPALDTSQEKTPAPAAEAPATKPQAGGTIRVDLDKVDRLVNLVGELVITQSMLVAQTSEFSIEQHPNLMNGLGELAQHSRELQEAVMSMRMQPVKSIFSRMPRIVRDVSQKLDKKIRLEMVGEATEVDKTVIEQLSDPLTHMIRNSLDHGIEMPETRKNAGKPEEGVITLSAYHQGNNIIIKIKDDGQGINRERVLNIAKERGVVPPDAQLEPNEIENLVFRPGFSTAEEVTDISGRGVGMDVVRRNIEGLGGKVSIKSTPGEGSEFTVSLPLTLAILDGMVVRVGQEKYIIPIANIIETLRPAKEDVHRIADGNDLINFRGEFVSILQLHKVFSIRGAEEDPFKALVILVETANERIGLVVDELVGQQQVVIKSLEANADPIEGVSGATILGDGKVSLILDITQLGEMAGPAHVPPHLKQPREEAA
jgi:two-component system chemotaxis sensor kinase CheA